MSTYFPMKIRLFHALNFNYPWHIQVISCYIIKLCIKLCKYVVLSFLTHSHIQIHISLLFIIMPYVLGLRAMIPYHYLRYCYCILIIYQCWRVMNTRYICGYMFLFSSNKSAKPWFYYHFQNIIFMLRTYKYTTMSC